MICLLYYEVVELTTQTGSRKNDIISLDILNLELAVHNSSVLVLDDYWLVVHK